MDGIDRLHCRACGKKQYKDGLDGGFTKCRCLNKQRTGVEVPPGTVFVVHEEKDEVHR